MRDPEMLAIERLQRELRAGAMRAAPALLGCVLERRLNGMTLCGRIVETEAYTAEDPSSHSFGGRTNRNSPMFGPAGTVYVYISYGMHRCLNVVTGTKGTGEAALIRAVEPLEGIEEMIAARSWGDRPLRHLANGPGKLCQALAIGLEHNLLDLFAGGVLRLVPGGLQDGESMAVTPRIGISKAADWPRRFVISGNPCLSRRG